MFFFNNSYSISHFIWKLFRSNYYRCNLGKMKSTNSFQGCSSSIMSFLETFFGGELVLKNLENGQSMIAKIFKEILRKSILGKPSNTSLQLRPKQLPLCWQMLLLSYSQSANNFLNTMQSLHFSKNSDLMKRAQLCWAQSKTSNTTWLVSSMSLKAAGFFPIFPF